jgi:hypothetical protein
MCDLSGRTTVGVGASRGLGLGSLVRSLALMLVESSIATCASTEVRGRTTRCISTRPRGECGCVT